MIEYVVGIFLGLLVWPILCALLRWICEDL